MEVLCTYYRETFPANKDEPDGHGEEDAKPSSSISNEAQAICTVLSRRTSGRDRGMLNLNGADLRGADLSRADLTVTDLRGADLSGADLSDANLMKSDLRDAFVSEEALEKSIGDPAALPGGYVAE